MKKFGVLLLCIVLVFSFVVVNVIGQDTDIPGTNIPGLNPEKIKELGEKSPDELGEEAKEKASYLGQEWSKILRKNPVITGLDNFFTKINFVFKLLFAEDYVANFSLVLIIVLWIFVASSVEGFIKNQFDFPRIASFIIGFLSAVIVAQIRVYRFIVDFIVRIATAPELWWVRIIIWVIVLVIIGLMFYLQKFISQYSKQRKEVLEKEAGIHRQKKLEKFSKGVGLE